MNSTLSIIEQGDAAHTAVKKNIVLLIKSVTVGIVPPTLYAKDFLDDDTWELLPVPEVSPSTKGDRIVRDIQKRVRANPNMLDTLCQILSCETGTEELAKQIHGTLQGTC